MKKFIEKNKDIAKEYVKNHNLVLPEVYPKVLLVDDDYKNIFAMRIALEDLDLEIIEVTSGIDALRAAAAHNLALILLDVNMTDMSGFEVVELLNKNRQTRNIPVIFVTAINKDINCVQQGHLMGAVDYLFKPIEPTILKSKVSIFIKYYIQNEQMLYLLNQLSEAKISLENSNKQLNEMARIDAVTGLSNRFSLDEYLEATLKASKESNSTFAVVYLDLDNFKYVNDTHGHDLGDELLKEVSKRIKSVIRKSDAFFFQHRDALISRLGGDEFAIVLSDIDSSTNAGTVGKRLVEEIEKPFNLKNNFVKISVSVGIACFPHAGDTAKSLQKAADIAMYKAKKHGKNNFQYYTEELDKKHNRELQIESGLRKAIGTNDIKIFYQPIISLVNKKIVAVEALCRWNDKELGDVSPDEFIRVAEETGLIRELGEYILILSLMEFKDYIIKQKQNIQIHINLSIKQFEERGFIDFTKEIISKYRLNPSSIVFELTETALMLDEAMVVNKVNILHELGCGISVDDFGTGYSSFSYLNNFPVSSIKIDKSFVEKCNKDNSASVLLTSMINLANNLGMESIVEGVETQEQIDFLKDTECKCIQGYYFAKPMPVIEFVEFLQSWNAKQ